MNSLKYDTLEQFINYRKWDINCSLKIKYVIGEEEMKLLKKQLDILENKEKSIYSKDVPTYDKDGRRNNYDCDLLKFGEKITQLKFTIKLLMRGRMFNTNPLNLKEQVEIFNN